MIRWVLQFELGNFPINLATNEFREKIESSNVFKLISTFPSSKLSFQCNFGVSKLICLSNLISVFPFLFLF